MSLRNALLAACMLFVALDAGAAGHRRALLVGINDYTASTLARSSHAASLPNRDWRDLSGGVNDVAAIREMLVALYGFDRRDIVTLTDQAATRTAILQALQGHLAGRAAKDDVLLFYYAGHGSQVRNSLSDERDKLDESIVPADSRIGAPDIRDKELRVLFNRILDRGAHLTVILDDCHSGSGARGLPTGARPRGIKPDLRDVADRTKAGPRPEDRGALVLSAAEDFAEAWETRDAGGNMHGAFSWAWMRAMRDASPAEPAAETFLRAQARLRGEMPFQEPVMAGNADARRTPFLGGRADRLGDRAVVAVQKIAADGSVVLAGGWANGLTVGSELRTANDARSPVRLTVTAIRGLTESAARVRGGAVRAGALLEIAGWAAPPDKPLRVAMPRMQATMEQIAAAGRAFAAAAAAHDVRWIADPVAVTPSHLLRWGTAGWELLDAAGHVAHLGTSQAAAVAAVAKIPPASSLFVQLPAPAAAVAKIAGDGIEVVERPEEADYILTGRYGRRGVTYAWVRPSMTRADRRKIGLPLRTAWVKERLGDALPRLRKIHAWTALESPPGTRFAYRLGLRRIPDGLVPRDGVVLGNERYELVLRAAAMPLPKRVPQRCVYVFTIDSDGRSTLLFPPRGSGSVENRFPAGPPEPQIALGESSAFAITPPYGVDTYFLLTSDEPLPNPWILEWDGVRGGGTEALTPLERLLVLTSSGTRSVSLLTPAAWSIERVTFESRAASSRK